MDILGPMLIAFVGLPAVFLLLVSLFMRLLHQQEKNDES